MRLKEKTHRKFIDFFEKMSALYQGNEFELAFSDIQRETGAASVTLKRAIKYLEADGVLKIQPGRNSRYARFQYLSDLKPTRDSISMEYDKLNIGRESKVNMKLLVSELNELTTLTENLRRRVRTQEMSIALLQDRLAEIEEKLYRNNNYQ
ncbi:MAG: IclR family transcriptional regulator [Desulfitobacteriaceae bacterium]|nr:IclR family transcriptional regulator [Desulfitobacteriaceae bacterium]MDD4347124.1 IclR family transcriptional regulator [Desulfitobacteriaceae bacterium]MDD4402951.1 IclR family transcriptional regulator [Desulfitobacteriaceae bacterium]